MSFTRETLKQQRARREKSRRATNRNLARRVKNASTATMTGGVSGEAVEKAQFERDEAHRRWVASLPCFECRIEGHSQAAHPNTGKGKGMKQSDDECFPMCCDRPGVVGCHTKFDQYKLVPRADMPAYEARALAWTRGQQP